MKSIPFLLTAPLCLFVLAPVLIFVSANAGAIAASLVIVAGLGAIVVFDYGRSATPSYTLSRVAATPTSERLPLAA